MILMASLDTNVISRRPRFQYVMKQDFFLKLRRDTLSEGGEGLDLGKK